ncbi:MAG: hypothetical protein LBK08_10295 [Treponema sp.]|jgi:hypothetical protein|nr:hypothetical protein [Treponema sp.]
MTDIFEGDPRIVLTANGADLNYRGGQPTMDTGVENTALISLFTKPGWPGNIFAPPENRIGSDFEDTCRGSITLRKLLDIENSGRRALTSKTFPDVTVDLSNPASDNLRIHTTLGPGGALNLVREGALWKNQAADPAYRKVVKGAV